VLKEFREFLNRGNVMDLAIAVVIGMSFNLVINSLVEDIITPLIGIIMGGVNFAELAIQVGNATLTYGNFLQAVFDFVLTAFALFLIVKAYNRFRRKEEKKEEEETPTDSKEVILLTQIRDLLEDGARPNVQRQPREN
jgi:large conductance mechanosensitive channel